MRRPLAVALLALAGLGAAGCGGGGGEETGSTSGTSTLPAAEEDQGGGEKSIEEYGSEAGGSDRGSILGSFTGYLSAIAEDDPATACSYLSVRVQESLGRFVGKGESSLKCAQILPKLLAPTAAAITREQASGKVTTVRVKGDRAFVVFRAPGAKLYMLGLAREGGEWKATTVAASVLVPAL
jgi:hypothetical protein